MDVSIYEVWRFWFQTLESQSLQLVTEDYRREYKGLCHETFAAWVINAVKLFVL